MNYKKMFEMDLQMLKVRSSYNTAYEWFIRKMKDYKVENKKDWDAYELSRDSMVVWAWTSFSIDNK